MSPSSGSEVTRHQPANTHGAKTQDFYNSIMIITMRNSNLTITLCFMHTKTCFMTVSELLKIILDDLLRVQNVKIMQ
jgi:hypothetical protein